jgi:hypothetical protein
MDEDEESSGSSGSDTGVEASPSGRKRRRRFIPMHTKSQCR